MNRDEYIEDYTCQSDLSQYRTPDGYTVGRYTMIALPCDCGEDFCDGWAMVSAETALEHCRLNAPQCIRSGVLHLPFALTNASMAAITSSADPRPQEQPTD